MSFTNDLLAGLAQILAAEVGATWRPDGAYPTGVPWPVLLAVVPPSPDQVITLTPYGVSENPQTSDVVQGVQVRTRGTRDPRPVTDLNDAIFDALHGREHTVIGGIPVVLAYRQSAAYLGPDSNGRHEHTANFYLQAARPSPHRPD